MRIRTHLSICTLLVAAAPGHAAVTGFSIHDASTDQRLMQISPSGVYELVGRSLAFTADGPAGGERVTITIQEQSGAFHSARVERVAPYASFGDTDGDLNGRYVPAGSYVASAVVDGREFSVAFQLTDGSSGTPVDPAPSAHNGTDFFSLHYDFAPDPDDVLSAVFDRAIIENENIPLSQVLMVKGTVGTNAGHYKPAQANAMDAIWPKVTKLDAKNNLASAAANAAQRWAETIQAGGDVWVKEGGQSDFTAEVVRRLLAEQPALDTRTRVHVVQHSVWNEDNTTPSDLSYVKSNTDYIKIDDGNSKNGTADLNEPDDPVWWQQAESSNYGSAVAVANDFLNKIDGSDTVELLWALDIGLAAVADVHDMLYRYLSAGPGSGSDAPDDGGDVGCEECIGSVTFVDPSSDRYIYAISDGGSYDLAGEELAIHVAADGVAAVTIRLSGPVDSERTERDAPYSSFGDTEGDYAGVTLPAGDYRLDAEAVDSGGQVIDSVSMAFTLR